MTGRLLSGVCAGLCVALTLMAFDLGRLSPGEVPEPGGWSYMGGALLVGLIYYVPPALLFFALLALVTGLIPSCRLREAGARTGPASLLAGWAAGMVFFILALFAISSPAAGDEWLSSSWILELGMSAVGCLLAGVSASRLASAFLGRFKSVRSLTLLGLFPALSALVLSLPLFVAAGWPFPPARPPAAAGLPDIFLIVADTLRADGIAAAAERADRTPVIRALAERGVAFTDATAQASWTNPSTATILTGLMPADHGMWGYAGRLHPEILTLPEILRSRGYETVGITANPLISRAHGFNRGFDHWDEEPGEGLLARHRGSLAARIAHGAGGGAGPYRTLTAEKVVDRALPLLRRPRSAPLFLYLHFMDPHDPYGPPPGQGRPVDPGYEGSLAFEPDTLYGILRGEIRVSARDLEHARALYRAEIDYMDGQIGRLLDEIEPDVSGGGAVVAFTSDHGEEFMEHGALGHEHTLYQELIHVPWILARPGHLPAGRAFDEPVSHLDLLPTLLALAGLPPKEGLPGRSLADALTTPAGSLPATAILSEEDYVGYRAVSHRLRAVREGPWKVILSSPNVFGIGPWKREVYELRSDPREAAPISDPAADAVAAEARLRQWLGEIDSRPTRRGPLDPETERRLRALGYIE